MSMRGVNAFQQIRHQREGRKPIINRMSLQNRSTPEKRTNQHYKTGPLLKNRLNEYPL